MEHETLLNYKVPKQLSMCTSPPPPIYLVPTIQLLTFSSYPPISSLLRNNCTLGISWTHLYSFLYSHFLEPCTMALLSFIWAPIFYLLLDRYCYKIYSRFKICQEHISVLFINWKSRFLNHLLKCEECSVVMQVYFMFSSNIHNYFKAKCVSSTIFP